MKVWHRRQAIRGGRLVHGADNSETPAIQFADVRLAFAGEQQDVLALDGVSFDVPPEKITTVVGPSGCGKTTLLRLAAGLLTASEGAVLYKGTPVLGLNTNVGYVTQDSNLFPWLTALGNVEFPLAIRGVATAERREKAPHLLRLGGALGFEKNHPPQPSGGTHETGAILRTLIYWPPPVPLQPPFC